MTSRAGTLTMSCAAGSVRDSETSLYGPSGEAPGAFVDVGQIADEHNGEPDVLVIGAGVAVPVKGAKDVVDQIWSQPLAGHAPLFRRSRVGGLKSAAMPVPVAGRQRLWGR